MSYLSPSNASDADTDRPSTVDESATGAAVMASTMTLVSIEVKSLLRAAEAMIWSLSGSIG
mgnify:CR=1 FL=1